MSMNSEEKFKSLNEYRIHRVKHWAKKYKWVQRNLGSGLMQFSRKYEMLFIDSKCIHIISCLNHPKYGKTVMVRKGAFTEKIIESIFRNPRQHTGKKIQSIYL